MKISLDQYMSFYIKNKEYVQLAGRRATSVTININAQDILTIANRERIQTLLMNIIFRKILKEAKAFPSVQFLLEIMVEKANTETSKS